MIKGYRDGGRKAEGSLWSEVITTRGLEWKCRGRTTAQITPGWWVSSGLRASCESPINKSYQPPGPPIIWLGKSLEENNIYLEYESRNIFNIDFRAIDLIDSFRAGIRKHWLEQWGGEAGKRAPALRMPSALWQPVHTLEAKLIEKQFSSWHGTKDQWESLDVFGLLDPTSGPEIRTAWF